MYNNFIFDQFINSTPDLATATVYAHLVNTVPAEDNTFVNTIDYVKDLGYSLKPVISTLILPITVGQKRWNIAPINFGRLNLKKTVYGVVFAVQVGTNPNPDTDLTFAYFELVNEFNNATPIEPGNQEVLFKIRNSAAALIDNVAYRYSVHRYVGQPLFADLMMMIWTAANTNDPFVGPNPTANSAAQNFFAPLNNSKFLDKTEYSDLITSTCTVTNTGVINKLAPEPIYEFWTPAYFNGSAKLAYSGYADFNLETGINFAPAKKSLITFTFFPENQNSVQTLLDMGSWSVQLAANNTVQLIKGATAIISTTRVALYQDWNTISIYQTADQVFGLSLNGILNISAAAQTSLITSSLTVGAKSGGTQGFTGFISLLSKWTGITALDGVTPTFNSKAPWNSNYSIYLPQTSDLTNTNMTSQTTFNAFTSVFQKSASALNHPRIKNVGDCNGLLANISTPATNWVYDFGLNKAKIGQVSLLFDNSNSLTCKNFGVDPTDSDYNNGKLNLQVWASNNIPDNILSNSNLNDELYWDVYTVETLLEGEELDLTETLSNKSYRHIDILTDVSKYYRYYRIGFVNSINPGNIVGAEFLGILLFESTIISPTENLLPPAYAYVP